jgi:hypothetical protein
MLLWEVAMRRLLVRFLFLEVAAQHPQVLMSLLLPAILRWKVANCHCPLEMAMSEVVYLWQAVLDPTALAAPLTCYLRMAVSLADS